MRGLINGGGGRCVVPWCNRHRNDHKGGSTTRARSLHPRLKCI